MKDCEISIESTKFNDEDVSGLRTFVSLRQTQETHKRLFDILRKICIEAGHILKFRPVLRSRDKTDYDVIRENHKFLWDQEDIPDTWGAKLAKKYYDKLFKEYCICNLTYYKFNKVALRWRTEKEVIAGKGQFECGSKMCNEKENLRSWELNFGYIEHGEKKNALVKLRLCPECSIKLNYRSQKREVKRKKSLKRLGTSPKSDNVTPITSDNRESDNKTEIDPSPVQTQTNIESTDRDESNIWKEKPAEDMEKTREKEFEEYLADLFM